MFKNNIENFSALVFKFPKKYISEIEHFETAFSHCHFVTDFTKSTLNIRYNITVIIEPVNYSRYILKYLFYSEITGTGNLYLGLLL